MRKLVVLDYSTSKVNYHDIPEDNGVLDCLYEHGYKEENIAWMLTDGISLPWKRCSEECFDEAQKHQLVIVRYLVDGEYIYETYPSSWGWSKLASIGAEYITFG